MRKTITPNERLQLLGLLTVAQQHYAVEKQMAEAIDSILEDEEHYSLMTDAIYEAPTDIDVILKNMEIEVSDATA